MSMVSEDLLDLDWKDYEGVIGHDPMTHKYQVQLNHHLHWFDTSCLLYTSDAADDP